MEPFTKGWRIYDVPVFTNEKDTLYTLKDDWMAFLMIYLSFGLLVFGAVRRVVDWKKKR